MCMMPSGIKGKGRGYCYKINNNILQSCLFSELFLQSCFNIVFEQKQWNIYPKTAVENDLLLSNFFERTIEGFMYSDVQAGCDPYNDL